MSNLTFLDNAAHRQNLYPFTLLREAIDLPLGLLTLREKWSALFPAAHPKKKFSRTIATAILPDFERCQAIGSLKTEQSLFSKEGQWIASGGQIDRIPKKATATDMIFPGSISLIKYPWDLLDQLGRGIQLDFSILTKGRKSASLPQSVVVNGEFPVFLEKGARVMPCFLNTEAGPIYIGKGAEVQEGVMIRGPFLLGDRSVVKMGAKIYGPTAAGEHCLLGGEIKRSLLFPFSNKAHEGYMGDSVIGSWCNWGAGTSNSNLKNTAGDIEIEVGGVKLAVGQKAGVYMGDHSRTVINSSLNSGTVIGVSVQVGNEGLPPKRMPSFRWIDGSRYRFQAAMNHIRQWKVLKGQELTSEEIDRLKKIYKTDK